MFSSTTFPVKTLSKLAVLSILKMSFGKNIEGSLFRPQPSCKKILMKKKCIWNRPKEIFANTRISPFHGSWKVTKLLREAEAKVDLTVREVEIMDMLIISFLMIVISTFVTVPGQKLPRFHVEAWLPYRNCEMDYWSDRCASNKALWASIVMFEKHIMNLIKCCAVKWAESEVTSAGYEMLRDYIFYQLSWICACKTLVCNPCWVIFNRNKTNTYIYILNWLYYLFEGCASM